MSLYPYAQLTAHAEQASMASNHRRLFYTSSGILLQLHLHPTELVSRADTSSLLLNLRDHW
eukprot:31852-Eustigmatos_ZCMA.PRE.1